MSDPEYKQGELDLGKEVSLDSMTTAITDEPTEETESNGISALANFQDAPSFSSEDLLIPRLRLAQGLTQEVQDGIAKPGEWLLTGFEAQKEITVVPILYTRRRELRDEDFQTLCSSDDAITGVGDPGGECASCPMNQWTEEKKTGKRNPPKCSFAYTYLVYVIEHESLAAVDFKRTGLKAGKLLNTICAQKGLGNFAVRLKAGQQQGKKGNFYIPTVQPVTIDTEVLKTARALMRH